MPAGHRGLVSSIEAYMFSLVRSRVTHDAGALCIRMLTDAYVCERMLAGAASATVCLHAR